MWDAVLSDAFRLSLRVAVTATFAIVIVGTPLALWLARDRGVGSRLTGAMLSLPMVVPPVATGYVLLVFLTPSRPPGRWLAEVGVRLALDWKGAAVASSVLALPLFLAVAKAAFEGCDRGLAEAARTLNASPFRVFVTVTLPLALPGVLAGGALAFARAFGEFGATMMLAGNIPGETRTVPQAIYSHLMSGRDEAAWHLVIVSIVVGAAAMLVAQRLTSRRAQGAS